MTAYGTDRRAALAALFVLLPLAGALGQGAPIPLLPGSAPPAAANPGAGPPCT